MTHPTADERDALVKLLRSVRPYIDRSHAHHLAYNYKDIEPVEREILSGIDNTIAALAAPQPAAAEAVAETPRAYEYKYHAQTTRDEYVWVIGKDRWNGQTPLEVRPLYWHPAPTNSREVVTVPRDVIEQAANRIEMCEEIISQTSGRAPDVDMANALRELLASPTAKEST